jgi:hypothetical protein
MLATKQLNLIVVDVIVPSQFVSSHNTYHVSYYIIGKNLLYPLEVLAFLGFFNFNPKVSKLISLTLC